MLHYPVAIHLFVFGYYISRREICQAAKRKELPSLVFIQTTAINSTDPRDIPEVGVLLYNLLYNIIFVSFEELCVCGDGHQQSVRAVFLAVERALFAQERGIRTH